MTPSIAVTRHTFSDLYRTRRTAGRGTAGTPTTFSPKRRPASCSRTSSATSTARCLRVASAQSTRPSPGCAAGVIRPVDLVSASSFTCRRRRPQAAAVHNTSVPCSPRRPQRPPRAAGDRLGPCGPGRSPGGQSPRGAAHLWHRRQPLPSQLCKREGALLQRVRLQN